MVLLSISLTNNSIYESDKHVFPKLDGQFPNFTILMYEIKKDIMLNIHSCKHGPFLS